MNILGLRIAKVNNSKNRSNKAIIGLPKKSIILTLNKLNKGLVY